MPTPTGYSRSPKLQHGALIQLTRDIIGIVPSITLFQYNPEKIDRTFEINARSTGPGEKGMQAPLDQPYPPDESLSFTLELDATDDLERGRLLTETFGISDRLAVLEKLVFASNGLLGDALGSVAALFGGDPIAERPTVPIVILALGRRRVFPVRVTSLSITELFHSPEMMPIHASVQLGLHIMSDEEFRPNPCKFELDVKLAQATYRLYRAQRDLLAIAHIATVVSDIKVT
jgi:hypothetical protein